MRDHVTVMNERSALAAYSTTSIQPVSPEFSRFLRGAGAALDWTTGRTKSPPVSHHVAEPDSEAIAAEVQRCDALLVGTEAIRTSVRADPHYVNGVEHALRWLLELESEPPVPLLDDVLDDAVDAAPAA